MYDPKLARFLQEDTYSGDSSDPLSLNLYAYCHNEPVMYTDPTGHSYTDYSGQAYSDAVVAVALKNGVDMGTAQSMVDYDIREGTNQYGTQTALSQGNSNSTKNASKKGGTYSKDSNYTTGGVKKKTDSSPSSMSGNSSAAIEAVMPYVPMLIGLGTMGSFVVNTIGIVIDADAKKATNDIMGFGQLPFLGTSTGDLINTIGDELYNLFFYNDREERINNNYEINSKLDFDLNDYIYDQSLESSSPAWDARMGVGKGFENGCGWIAIYNVLHSLGDTRHPADIIKWLEENDGLLAGGRAGVNPLSARDYFRDMGYDAVICFDNFDANAKSGRAAIFGYAWDTGDAAAAHFVMAKWDDSDTQDLHYNIYNVYSGDTDLHKYDSIDDFIASGGTHRGLLGNDVQNYTPLFVIVIK